jgi:eukaryotic-like serine/threonine-protein kinase
MNPGDLLRNRYRIEKALAAGGFGETYLAVDLDYPGQRQVVVKHLKPAHSDPKTLEIARRLFESEAKVLAELGETSDRLPALYAYFEEQGEFYLVQEFIAGQTLTNELGGQQLSEVQTIGVLQEILAGLVVVHGKNKIHRDLKPDNIIRRAKDGKLVLIDFGAVKEVRQATNLGVKPLSASIGIGTQGYMPTEQAIGFPRLASDVYAVGAIGIQCLTGQAPHGLFDESVLALRWQHLCQVSTGLAEVLEKMVAQQPNERYENGLVAREAIDRLLVARQPSPPTMPSPAAPIQQSKPPTPAPTQKAYVPPVQPAAQTVKVKTQAPDRGGNSANNRSRRNFLKWLGFGGVGVVGVLALNQLGKNSSTSQVETVTTTFSSSKPDTDSSPLMKSRSASKLTKIQFTSVKLDSYGKIVDRPAGSAEIFTEDLGNAISLTMVKIPAGKFTMGSPTSEKNRDQDESPQHQVTLPAFFLGQMLVTQAQWQSIMGNNPSHFTGDSKLPVDSVTWLEAMDFCQKLSQKTGHTYRLPNEAEWEYACRAGTTTPFAFGETITPVVVNYKGDFPYASAAKEEYRQKTTIVGSFPANPFGLHDMHGNLWEWCLDEWFNNYNGAHLDGSALLKDNDSRQKRLLRGGSWRDGSGTCRSANRLKGATSFVYDYDVGLRVVSVLTSSTSRQSS